MAVVFALITAFATYKFFDHIFIVCTSLLGSFLLVRGIGAYAGHYYSISVLESMISEGIYD